MYLATEASTVRRSGGRTGITQPFGAQDLSSQQAPSRSMVRSHSKPSPIELWVPAATQARLLFVEGRQNLGASGRSRDRLLNIRLSA